MTEKRFTILTLFIISFFWLGLPTIVLADNSHVPDEYEAAYHKLLEKRQHLMDDRADSIRNLNQCDSWLNQIDKALQTYSPLLNRQNLISSRSYILTLKDKFHKDLDYEEGALQSIEKDLAWLEGEMKHFAIGWR